jgi:hypothetical protein
MRHTLRSKTTPGIFRLFISNISKQQDSGRSFIKPGSFLIQMQADATGPVNLNTGKMYFRWPKHFAAGSRVFPAPFH